MCGIAGVHRLSDKPVPKLNALADELMFGILPRGYDAAGYLAIADDGTRLMEKMVGPYDRVLRKKKKHRIPNNTRTLLLHTRWATKGDKRDVRNAHPVTHGRTAAIHNGTIYNDKDIFRAFKLERNADVDSVAIPAIIDHAGWDKAEDAVTLLEGGAACAVVHDEHPGELLLFTFGHWPIVYGHNDDILVWASTSKAIQEAWHYAYGRKVPFQLYQMSTETAMRANGRVEEPVRLKMPKPKLWTPGPAKVKTKKKGKKQQPNKSAAASAKAFMREFKKGDRYEVGGDDPLDTQGVIIWNGGRWWGDLHYLGPAKDGESDNAQIVDVEPDMDEGTEAVTLENPTSLSDEAWLGLVLEVADMLDMSVPRAEIREELEENMYLFDDEVDVTIRAAEQVIRAEEGARA